MDEEFFTEAATNTAVPGAIVVIIGILCIVILILVIVIKKMGRTQSTVAARVSEKISAEPHSERAVSDENTLFCSQCGTKLPPDSSFCVNCGKKL